MVVEALQIAGVFTGVVAAAFAMLALIALSLAWFFDGDGVMKVYGLLLFVAMVFSIVFFSVLGVKYADLDKDRPAPSDDGAVHIVVPDIIDITVKGGGNPLERSEGNQAERDDGLR